MRYLGIDYGKKRIGISVSDGEGSIAFPRKVLPNDGNFFRELTEIMEAENVGAIVVGDARTLAGDENAITSESDAFVEKLQTTITIPVHRMREAYSSAEAMRFAPKGKRHDDSSAAAIILQRFLDARVKSE